MGTRVNMKKRDIKKLIKAMANQPMSFLGGDTPSSEDISNRIAIAWYERAKLRFIQEGRAYGESLRTPEDTEELPVSPVEQKIAQSWELAEEVYGKKVAERLKFLCPYDGALLCDIAFYSLLMEGLSKEKAYKKLFSYSEKDWADTLDLWWERFKDPKEDK